LIHCKHDMQDEPDKSALRRALLAQRQQITPEVRQIWDAHIAERVLDWWRTARPPWVGVYWPMRGEPDLRALYARLVDEGAQLALPLAARKNAPLAFAPWKPGDALVKDALGVWVPAAGTAAVNPEALLIPCVGFNSRNQRLGYGGGYYDRTLARQPRPATLGIAYAYSRCEFEGDAHDVALERVITETG
jgi:5-formyltetrahydrofolate cyclo-ligase